MGDGESREKDVMDAARQASKELNVKVPFQQKKLLPSKFRACKSHPIKSQAGRQYQNRRDTLSLITHVGTELKMTLVTKKMMTPTNRSLSLNTVFIFGTSMYLLTCMYSEIETETLRLKLSNQALCTSNLNIYATCSVETNGYATQPVNLQRMFSFT
ncbi:unnamed protein product [Fraxinus pennsylvanica]|uniref:Uncharacterized protein n=1 Tax=Fraxinus pennsylvanica TaxID=56036 RepID=A0AAD1YXT1_9LAMI|nr:unnamed protein product [Fraxinus pennsylvanica]